MSWTTFVFKIFQVWFDNFEFEPGQNRWPRCLSSHPVEQLTGRTASEQSSPAAWLAKPAAPCPFASSPDSVLHSAAWPRLPRCCAIAARPCPHGTPAMSAAQCRRVTSLLATACAAAPTPSPTAPRLKECARARSQSPACCHDAATRHRSSAPARNHTPRHRRRRRRLTPRASARPFSHAYLPPLSRSTCSSEWATHSSR